MRRGSKRHYYWQHKKISLNVSFKDTDSVPRGSRSQNSASIGRNSHIIGCREVGISRKYVKGACASGGGCEIHIEFRLSTRGNTVTIPLCYWGHLCLGDFKTMPTCQIQCSQRSQHLYRSVGGQRYDLYIWRCVSANIDGSRSYRSFILDGWRTRGCSALHS